MSKLEKRLVAALEAAAPQLREVWNQHSAAMGFVMDCTCDLCALLWVADATPEQWRRRLDERGLDASQPVKPPVLPEPDLRLMGEAVKGGKYPEQPVKP